MARDERITFRLTTDVKEKLDKYAGEYGMATPLLVSFIVGSWIRQQEQVLNPLLQEMTKDMKNTLGEIVRRDLKR